MSYEYSVEDFSCADHKDCTLTRFTSSNPDVGHLGDRHYHVWVDKAGDWGRNPAHVHIGHLTVGVLTDFDPETGAGVFDPDMQVLTDSADHQDSPIADRLNETYPWADDHNTGTKIVRGEGRVLPKPS